LQSDPYPRLLDLVLQSHLFKLGLCKFNVIINIINITLKSGVVAKPKILSTALQKNLIHLYFNFFKYFLYKKIKPSIIMHVTSNIKRGIQLLSIFINGFFRYF